MRNFTLHQRVRIIEGDERLLGKTGTVFRLRHADDMAFVDMDAPLPDDIARFPVGDDRRDHIKLWPDECAPIESVLRIATESAKPL